MASKYMETAESYKRDYKQIRDNEQMSRGEKSLACDELLFALMDVDSAVFEALLCEPGQDVLGHKE